MPEGGFGGIQRPGGGTPTLLRHRRGAALRDACGRVAADSGCRPPGCRLEPFQVTAGGRKARSWKERRGGRPLGPALRAAPNKTPRALEENAGRANEKGPPAASLYRGTAKNVGDAHPAIQPSSGPVAGHTYPLINKARCRRAWLVCCLLVCCLLLAASLFVACCWLVCMLLAYCCLLVACLPVACCGLAAAWRVRRREPRRHERIVAQHLPPKQSPHVAPRCSVIRWAFRVSLACAGRVPDGCQTGARCVWRVPAVCLPCAWYLVCSWCAPGVCPEYVPGACLVRAWHGPASRRIMNGAFARTYPLIKKARGLSGPVSAACQRVGAWTDRRRVTRRHGCILPPHQARRQSPSRRTSPQT